MGQTVGFDLFGKCDNVNSMPLKPNESAGSIISLWPPEIQRSRTQILKHQFPQKSCDAASG